MRPQFEEGMSLVFRRWTALLLALEGQWGGPTSGDKAQALYEDALDWFYRQQGAHACACMCMPWRHSHSRGPLPDTAMLSRSLCGRAGPGPGRGL